MGQAVGRGRQAPVIRQTDMGPAFAIGQMLPLSLACDHRVVDVARDLQRDQRDRVGRWLVQRSRCGRVVRLDGRSRTRV